MGQVLGIMTCMQSTSHVHPRNHQKEAYWFLLMLLHIHIYIIPSRALTAKAVCGRLGDRIKQALDNGFFQELFQGGTAPPGL
jgi:hypothetical protein